MKVILLKDVAKIGRRFDTVDVSDGYALNKLIPKNLAQAATPENLKRLQHVSAKVAKDREEQESHFRETLSALKDVEVQIAVEASSEGRMFQALKAEAIAEAIKIATGHELSVEHFIMKTPIKSTGEHIVDIASGSVHGTVTLSVISKSK
jgi:large subunit ribosomal protein L9